MSDLNYDYYELRTWGWLGLYRGKEVTWHYFSNPNDIVKFLYRITKLQGRKIKRVQAYAYVSKTGKRERWLEPHTNDFIKQIH